MPLPDTATDRDHKNATELLFGLGIPEESMERAVRRVANAIAGERGMTLRRLLGAMLKLTESEL